MSAGVALGLLLALATALASIFGFLYKHRGAVQAPPVEMRHPVRSSLALFRYPWYVVGMLVATAGWGFHVAALALAPISLVQSVIAGALVLLTVVADQVFEHRVTRREWIGVALTAAGLAFLAATLEGTADEAHSDYETATLAVFVALCVGGALIAAFLGRELTRTGSVMALAAGLFWGGSDVTIKAVSDSLGDDGVMVVLHPGAAVILVASILGLVVSARSLQLGPAVPVIAITSAAANTTTIASGPIVFGEPLPDDPFGLAIRIAAFALVICAAAMTPPPARVLELEADVEAEPVRV